MTSTITDKKPQTLYRSTTPENFLEQFELAIGCSLESLVRRFAARESIIGILLVGSIPLGIGSAASDIDLYVLLDQRSALQLPKHKSDDGVLFTGTIAGDGARLMAGAVVLVSGSIEIDIEFLVSSEVFALLEQLPSALVSPRDIRVLSRLKSGWVLASSETLASGIDGIRRGQRALELRCVDSQMAEMLSFIQQARTVSTAQYPLAFHLGRRAVEAGFRAYFASRGNAFVGHKWLRFLAASKLSTRAGGRLAQDSLARLASLGLPLLFPGLDDPGAQPAEYLGRVQGFVHAIQETIPSLHGIDPALSPSLSPAASRGEHSETAG